MTSNDRKILIIKTGEALPPVREEYGDFEDWIAAGMGSSVDALEVASIFRGEGLPESSAISGVVVTGSPAMVTEASDWSEAAAEWLGDVVRADAIPVLGLCYGHQLLAHGLGGEVGTNPNGREMGTVDVTFSLPPSLPRSPDSGGGSVSSDVQGPEAPSTEGVDLFGPLFEAGVFPGHMSHVESVLRPPAGARILARTRLDPHSVIEFGPRQWGVQFHPEFDRPILQGYVEARREILTSEGLDPDQLMATATETPALSQILRRFVALVDEGS